MCVCVIPSGRFDFVLFISGRFLFLFLFTPRNFFSSSFFVFFFSFLLFYFFFFPFASEIGGVFSSFFLKKIYMLFSFSFRIQLGYVVLFGLRQEDGFIFYIFFIGMIAVQSSSIATQGMISYFAFLSHKLALRPCFFSLPGF